MTMPKEHTLTELQDENLRLRRLLSMNVETRVLAENLIAKVEMTPERIPFIVVSQAEFDAYLEEIGQAARYYDERWKKAGYDHALCRGRIVLWEWPAENWKEQVNEQR